MALTFYNGADDGLVYRTGVVRFDCGDPTSVVSRTDNPIFMPEMPWEKIGRCPTWCSSKEWSARQAGSSCITMVRTSTWASSPPPANKLSGVDAGSQRPATPSIPKPRQGR